MKVLHLTMKQKWYDMIASGEKKEEYRAMTPYWITRFKYESDGGADRESGYNAMIINSKFTHVRFARGGHFHESIPQMLIEIEDMDVKGGKPEWGAEPGIQYFVIHLGGKV